MTQPKKVKLDEDTEVTKLECKIADSSGAINMTVWGEAISQFENHKYYRISNARVDKICFIDNFINKIMMNMLLSREATTK